DIGDHVKKGQVLVVIDAPELVKELAAKRAMAKAAEAAIAQAQTSLQVARAQQKLSDATLKRQQQLFADKAVTDQQMDEIRSKADVATATSAEAEARIASAQANANVAAAEVGRLEALVQY